MERPTFANVLGARTRIAPYLQPTALREYTGLGRLIGGRAWVKHENHNPTGAFKVRGGINLIAQLDDTERARGVIAASTGNHGQSVAFAAKLFGVTATIYVPEGANPVKVQSMEDLGARVVFFGRDFDAAREKCEMLAERDGYRYIHSGNEPKLIEGVGTLTLEMLEQIGELDTILVPVGGGSGAAAACLVAKTVSPNIEVIGVQSSAAPAAYLSWKSGTLVEADNSTFAEGLATRTAFDLPQQIMREQLDDFVLVDDADLRRAIASMIESTRTLVEAAGAAALAGALKLGERLAGRRIALICSGGNITLDQLKEVLGLS